ncbi:MAG: TonB-dependent receptor plug domain-containing protein [Tannerella sp.]|jgi:outer membrane cobalamin receptor|nr:TonB-dependent receptor plug domain-containing protein [Tannerella sp.]
MFHIKMLCTSGLLAASVVSFAQGRLDSIQRLDEVTVVADRYREVIPSQRLAGEKLEALGSFSVADAIRYFSGILIKDYGGVGGLKTVDVRSMGTNHMGVFYDGIQLGNAQNGQVDLGKFSLDNIEEISLYNGQKSEIFQPAKDFGSAGTIYLRTRRPHFAGVKTTNIKAFFRTGSFGLTNPSVLWEQKIGERVGSSFNAEYIYSSGKYKFRYRKVFQDGSVAWDTTAVRRNGDIQSLRLEGGLNGYSEQGKWHVKAYLYDSEKGIPGAIINNVWKRSQRQWDRNFFVQGSYRQQVFEGYDLLVNVKYAGDRMRYLNPDTTLMYIDNTFLQQEIYASAANRYAILPNWDISLSADYQRNILDASLRDFVYPLRHTALTSLATAFEWHRLKAQASLLGTFVFESVTRIRHGAGERLPDSQTGAPDDRREYTPAVFLSFRPFAGENDFSPLQLRAFYKRIFRMPTFNDLYYTDAGNIALHPEYAVQYNLGLQYERHFDQGLIRYVNFRTDAYYNEVTDKIIAVPKGNGQYRWMMMNIGYVEIRGIDVSGQAGWHLPCGIRVNTSVNYTFQRAQDFSDPADNDPEAGTYGGQIAYIPRHNGSAIVNMIGKSWDLNYSFIYVGERYHNSSNIRENHEQPWYTHDLTLGKTFLYRNLKCKFSAEVNNLLNQYYDVVRNYPMPGRNYKLILKVEI